MLRSAAAALIVSLPILGVVHRTIEREIRVNSISRVSPPDEADGPPWERDGFFSHGAGEKTFRLSVPKPLPAKP